MRRTGQKVQELDNMWCQSHLSSYDCDIIIQEKKVPNKFDHSNNNSWVHHSCRKAHSGQKIFNIDSTLKFFYEFQRFVNINILTYWISVKIKLSIMIYIITFLLSQSNSGV